MAVFTRLLHRPISTAILTSKQKSRAALSLLKSERDPDRILEICSGAALTPTSPLHRTTLSLAVSALASSAALPAVRSLLRPLTVRFRPHAILLFGQARMLPDALLAFQESPTLPSLNALLSACILANDYPEAARVFREFPHTYRIRPNLDTYNTAIKAFCQSGSSVSVYRVLDEMSRKGIKPDTATFCNSLAGFYREERFDDVHKLLELMRRSECRPGLAIYNARVQGLCKLERSGEAKRLVKEMLSSGIKPNWVTYSNLIVGYCKEGDLEEAKKLYREMGRKGCVAGSSCYFTLINYLCHGGDFEAALEVCRGTMERNWVPCFSTMRMLVNGLVSSSKVEEAREIVERMKKKFPRNVEMWKEVEQGLPQKRVS